MIKARDVYRSMGYKEWRNFRNLIEKAVQLINSGTENGVILKTQRIAEIGFGAHRVIEDYEINMDAINLLNRISSQKLNKDIRLRNEAVMLTMLKKYCALKRVPFDFQFELDGYKYDCRINKSLLIEFDEQQHSIKRQKSIDEKKNLTAESNGYKLIRFDVSNDIVDIINTVGENITNIKNEDSEEINLVAIRIMRYISEHKININKENEPCILCEHNKTIECEKCHATESFELKKELVED